MKDKNGRMKQKQERLNLTERKVLNKKKNDQKKNSRSPVYYSLYGATHVLLQKWVYLVQGSLTESIPPRYSIKTKEPSLPFYLQSFTNNFLLLD